MVKFNLAKIFNPDASTNRLEFHFSSGLAPALNIVSALRFNEFTTSSTSGPMAEVDDNFEVVAFDLANRFIISAVFDVSMDFGMSETKSSYVNLRYAASLSDVYDVKERAGYNMETTMTTLSLGVGHFF